MSVARKRAKVKKKTRKKAGKKKRVSVNTHSKKAKKKKKKRPKPKPKPRPKPRPAKKRKAKKKKRRRITPEELDRLISERIKQAAREVGVSESEVKESLGRVAFEQTLPVQARAELAFLRRPDVSQQITERIIEKGLFDLTRGMVRTVESTILGQLIISEQRGNFHERALELAAQYDKPIREIYELWKSPDEMLAAAE